MAGAGGLTKPEAYWFLARFRKRRPGAAVVHRRRTGGLRRRAHSENNPEGHELRPLEHALLAGIRVVEDLSDEKVVQLAADRWEWSAMGREVSATDRVVEKVMRSELSPAKQRGFLGHCLMESRGVSAPMGKATAAAYRRVQRDLNVVLEAEMFEGGSGAGFVGFLDYAAGREVVRVA